MAHRHHRNAAGDSINPDESKDRSMRTWEKWIDIRNRQTNALAKEVNRPPVDLVMNIPVRHEKEIRTVLENAQRIRELPTIRDRPWEQPLRLQELFPHENVYQVFMTPADLGKPPVIEHIGVPTRIQQTEMGMPGVSKRLPFEASNKEFRIYRAKREADLKNEIKQIDPFRPYVEGIMCEGHEPKPPPPKIPPLPSIKVAAPTHPPCRAMTNVYALRINNSIFFNEISGQNLCALRSMQRECWHRHCCKWTYYFHIPINSTGRGHVYLQNLGTVTIRYCWKKIKKQIPYIPEEDVLDQVFFFNSSEDIIAPNQSKKIYFSFVSEKPGMYQEVWQFILCNVNFASVGKDPIVVDLRADAVENVFAVNKKVDKLLHNISRDAIYLIVREIINSALTKATIVEPDLYPYKKFFLECDMFILNNPVYYCHQTLVETLKNDYAEMCPKETWDLSIATWREKMMAKEYEERTHYYDILKQAHVDLLKPWDEGVAVKEQKFRAVKLILEQLMSEFDKEHLRIKRMLLVGDEPIDRTILEDLPFESDWTMQHNLFYLHMYDHVANAMSLCAGVISSIDLNRWIDFDFCRQL